MNEWMNEWMNEYLFMLSSSIGKRCSIREYSLRISSVLKRVIYTFIDLFSVETEEEEEHSTSNMW